MEPATFDSISLADTEHLSHQRRATDQSPRGYEPSFIDCPDDRPVIRVGSDLSPQELKWLPQRRNNTIDPIRGFLERASIPGFDSEVYLANVEKDATALPNIGIAISGGGYRAMLNGAGAIAAWDDRSPGSTNPGNLGGLLQSATYLSGLSGGNWLTGSIYANNFTTVQAAVASQAIWQFGDSILEGPQQYSLLSYYKSVFDAVNSKGSAGFSRSVTDWWGRMLSYQLLDAPNGGPGITFSSIASDTGFALGQTPLPISVANGRAPGQTIMSVNSTIIEINPWEMGSSDRSLNGYVPLRYAGSKFVNGSIPNNESCVIGFDNAGFVMGTSSSFFNHIILYLTDNTTDVVPAGTPDFAVKVLEEILEALGNDENDIADWTPNPFFGWNPKSNPSADSGRLTLVDGGEDLQSIPYWPHLIEDRKVDVVFSIDSSADTDTWWPNGVSAVATYERAIANVADGMGFPFIPGQDTFLNLGLNSRPTFFGCDSGNTTGPSPLIVYLPNYPYYYHSNISTFALSIEDDVRNAIISNGWAVATQANSTRDAQWPVCVGCAMLARSFERTRTAVPDACAQCFDRYCWNGTLAEHMPERYDPEYFGKPIKTGDSGSARLAGSAGMAMAMAAAVAVMTL
ncbi:Lysophospholipase 1 [Escovopsis weberi]|uniref:Lysophospholipase n=1 Tax=Escovopsis weberi TaxID=150374 RepID=A0A0M8N1Z0_ESCWE|nr:Lysophospholipase 1 [Escovopsis weberi]